MIVSTKEPVSGVVPHVSCLQLYLGVLQRNIAVQDSCYKPLKYYRTFYVKFKFFYLIVLWTTRYEKDSGCSMLSYAVQHQLRAPS